MKKASEYRRHADECRHLARSAQNEKQRMQFLDMAKAWDVLARDREWLIKGHPEVLLDETPPPEPCEIESSPVRLGQFYPVVQLGAGCGAD